MSQARAPVFSFKVGSHEMEDLSVRRISGREGLSRLYEFQVDFHSLGDNPPEARGLSGAEALLTVRLPGGGTRHVHGHVRAVDSLGRREGHYWYQARVVPRAWWLTRVQRSRIFQDKTVPQIVKAVLEEGGVKVKLSLSGSHEPREYCTQYRETDFAFVSRLLEWKGLFYFFQHTKVGHVLVVGDNPNVHEALPGGARLPLRESDGRPEDKEYLFSLQRIHRLRPGKVHLKDHDFERPGLDVSVKMHDPSRGQAALEVYDYPGEYVATSVGKAAARVRLEEAVQAARTLEGQGVCPSLTPGYRFEVEDNGTHADEYVVVDVVHSGQEPETTEDRASLDNLYHNRFKCMPAKVPFRPQRTTRVPHIPGVQTATVVGPSGEEIHTDEHGRIKVQFHWDRESLRDDKASCWVRVGQTWGGPAWGALYLPRIGQEVLVRFLEGNPDRPLIGGTLYNGNNPTPYALPDEKTKSTLKSASSLGSQGFNEFRIEDAAGREEIFVHGQKDEKLVTENDKEQQVCGCEELLVNKDRFITTEGNQHLDVTKNESSIIGGNQTRQVRGDRSTTVNGCHDEAMDGHQSITIAQESSLAVAQATSSTIGAVAALSVCGDYFISVGLALNEAVGGPKFQQIAGNYKKLVRGNSQEHIAGDSSAHAEEEYNSRIQGGLRQSTGNDHEIQIAEDADIQVIDGSTWLAKNFALKADTFSLIVDDKLILELEKSGAVKFFGKRICVEGSSIKMAGSKVQKLGVGALQNHSVKADDTPAIVDETPGNFIEFTVSTPDGKALANHKFEIHLIDGTVRKGTLDSSGYAQVRGIRPGSCKIILPELDLGTLSPNPDVFSKG